MQGIWFPLCKFRQSLHKCFWSYVCHKYCYLYFILIVLLWQFSFRFLTDPDTLQAWAEFAQIFLKSCLPGRCIATFFSQIHHSSTFLHATSFFHLFPSKTRSNMGSDGEKVRELSERRFEPRENIWKARTAQSSFVSASFERAAKIVCEICNFFSPGSSCNFAEINNLCAGRNNDDGVKHSFSISSALGCVSFEPVLTLWDWLLGET